MSEQINHKRPPAPAYAIDASIAERSECPECGGPGKYDSHYEDLDNGRYHYRAFVVCTLCGHREEF